MSLKSLRPFQKLFVDRVLEKALMPDKPDALYPYKVFIADCPPGSGKTYAAASSADALIAAGIVDTVVHLSPRLNLARQMERDSKRYCESPLRKALRWIVHRPNERVEVSDGKTCGYSTTFASVTRDLKAHCDALRGRKVLLIVDELQSLGVSVREDQAGMDEDPATTFAVRELAKMCVMVIGMTGTPYRADDKPLLFAEGYYSEPDEHGVCVLNADIATTYRVGVAEGYLRKFEFHLFGGTVDWVELDEIRKLDVETMRRRLGLFLQQKNFWQPMIDYFVAVCNDQRKLVSSYLCDLIACYNQKQAKLVRDYLKEKHNIDALIAVSEDGEEAHAALELFKTGRYKVLITVNMAYIGYDYPPISHICLLTGYRTKSYLFQLVARALRVMDSIPFEKQTCYLLAPKDLDMQEFTDWLQVESKLGMKERDQREPKPERPDDEPEVDQPPLGYVQDAVLGAFTARGYHEDGDVTSADYQRINEKRHEMNIPAPVTQLAAFLRSMKDDGRRPPPPPPPPTDLSNGRFMSENDKEKKARSTLADEVNKFAYQKLGKAWTENDRKQIISSVWQSLTHRDGKENSKRNLAELQACIVLVRKWQRGNQIV